MSPSRDKTFSPLHNAQIRSGAHLAGALSPRIKRLEREADHSPPSAEIKNSGALLALSHTSS